MRRFFAISMLWLPLALLLGCGVEPIEPTVSFGPGGNPTTGGGNVKPTVEAYLYVNLNQTQGGDGKSTAPFNTIQQAINAAQEKTEIRIAAGQYNQSIKLKAGVSLKGGYSPTDWSKNDPETHPTIINDLSSQGGPTIDQPIAAITIDNSHTPLAITNLTINGASVDNDTAASSQYNESAAALLVRNSSGVYLENLKIIGGNTGQYTFAVAAADASLTLSKSEVRGGKGNNAYGVYLTGQSNPLISSNSIQSSGFTVSSGIYSFATTPLKIAKNKIQLTSGSSSCYGIFAYAPNSGSSLVHNNLVKDMSCVNANIGVELRGETLRKGHTYLRNNTIAAGANGITSFSAPIVLKAIGDSPVEITNNLLLDRSSYLETGCIYEQESNSIPHMVRHNNFEGCNHLYRRYRGVQQSYHNTINELEGDVELNSHTNYVITSNLDATYKFVGNPNTNLTHGGIDGALEEWDFLDDLEGYKRSDDGNGIGWSIGAFEFN